VVSTATCSLVVAVPGRRRPVGPVVDPHEVGVFNELGDGLGFARFTFLGTISWIPLVEWLLYGPRTD
jgi:hypothetical protein